MLFVRSISLVRCRGVLATIDDDDVFSTVSVDRVAGTVIWPNGVDLDPDVLRGLESARKSTDVAGSCI